MDIQTIKFKVEEWVSDPGTMVGWLASYDRIVTTHWFMKEVVAHVLMDKENKELGNEEHVKS